MKPALAAGALLLTAVLATFALLDDRTAPADGPAGAAAARPAGGLQPLDVLPVESMLVWKGHPDPDLMPPPLDSRGQFLALIAQLGWKLAQAELPPSVNFGQRLLQGFNHAIRMPFAVALIDAEAKRTGDDGTGDVRGTNYKVLVAVDCDGDDARFLELIAGGIRELTDAGQATLETKEAAGYRYQELADRRLDWCKIAWGRIGDLFVMGFGTDVWPLAAEVAAGERTAVLRDAFVRNVRAPRDSEPLVEILVDKRRIADELDRVLDGRVTAFFDAWGAENIERAWWSIGFEGLALYTIADFDVGAGPDHIVHRVYADADVSDKGYLALVPPETRYAVFDVPAAKFLPRLLGGFYATRPREHQQAITREWERFQRTHDFDAERDILDNLGEQIVVHNYPQHPLKVPIAVTLLVPIENEPAATRARLRALCEGWQQALQAAAQERPTSNPSLLHRVDADTWYVNFGLIDAFAWTFTDRYVVVSWSPLALEDYLTLKDKALGLE